MPWAFFISPIFLICTNFVAFPERGIEPALQFAPTSTSDATLVNTTNGVTFLSYEIIFFRMFPFSKLKVYNIQLQKCNIQLHDLT